MVTFDYFFKRVHTSYHHKWFIGAHLLRSEVLIWSDLLKILSVKKTHLCTLEATQGVHVFPHLFIELKLL